MNLLAIIPCLNEAANLDRLIRQLLADRSVDLIVVADGGSSDGSREIVTLYENSGERVRLLDNPGRIQSAGVNLAVRRFGDGVTWLLRVDAHCEYPEGFASLVVKAASAQCATAVAVPMITQGKSGFQSAVAAAQNSVLGTGGSAHRHVGIGRFVDHGHHALIDRALFENVGGYCEAMVCNEDAEFDRRQTDAGGRIWLEPKAAITYFPRETPGALWRQYFRYGIGRARTVRRHSMRMHLRQAIPLAVPLALVVALLAPLHWIFSIPAILWLFVCLVVGAVIGLRSTGIWGLATGIAAAIMHLAWAIGFLIEWLMPAGDTGPRYGFHPSPAETGTRDGLAA